MRNMPTTRANRLSAVRLRLNAAVISLTAPVRAAAVSMRALGGKSAPIAAMVLFASASGTIRSIRSSLPTRPSTSCAVAISVISTPSRARRLKSSVGASSPTMVSVCSPLPTPTTSGSPLFSPYRSATAVLSRMLLGCTIIGVKKSAPLMMPLLVPK